MTENSQPHPEEGFGIPKMYWRNGRPEDQSFDPSESLYHRTNPALPLLDNQGNVNSAIFELLENTSVIRGKETPSPEVAALYDAKYGRHKMDWNVVKFSVGGVEKWGLSVGQGKDVHYYKVKVFHDILDFMFPHCEIRPIRDGEPFHSLSKSAKSSLKLLYADISEVVMKEGSPV